jgi:homoserine/homoserine lactone efflux protein
VEILAFILVSIGIIIIPGPNVLIVVSTSVAHGKVRGLQTVAGTSTAMFIQLCIAALGTSWFVSTLANGFVWLKWLGVIYLLYLGVSHLLASRNNAKLQSSAVGTFQRGFWVSLTNPKTILFFSALLPQFTSAAISYPLQIAVLSLIFWLLAVALDSGYALLAHKLSSLLKTKSQAKYQHAASGALYLGAGAILATTKYG